MRLKLPLSRPPTGLKFTPASSETAVEPRSPAATIRAGEANAAACTGSGDGVTSDAVSPPSTVRTSWSPLSVAKTQSCAEAQRIALSVADDPDIARGDQVAPPSFVRSSSEPSPAA
jgi:hypothetical protein